MSDSLTFSLTPSKFSYVFLVAAFGCFSTHFQSLQHASACMLKEQENDNRINLKPIAIENFAFMAHFVMSTTKRDCQTSSVYHSYIKKIGVPVICNGLLTTHIQLL